MKTNKSFQLNIPITKIDEEQRIVTGIATSEALDSQGDIVDYDASKKAFTDWPGNIREMHGPVAIGKGIDVQFDDDSKQVIVSAKISESADGENAWIKVKEQILTGFSIGGRVFEVAKDKAVEGANRILDYTLSELSLVDNPANPQAELLMVKSVDGAALQRVEEDKSKEMFPQSWWAQKFMGAPMQKSVYDAGTAISLATQLTWLITSEADEPDQQQDLITAFNALRDFAAKEVQEGDDFDWATEFATVVELANNAINLRKGTIMSDKKDEKSVEKTNVVGGVERDVNAEVIAHETPTTEEATPIEEAEVTTKPEDEKVIEPEAPVTEEPADDAKPGDIVEPTEEKADTATDLLKSVKALLTKFDDTKSADLTKVTDVVEKLSDKVEKSLSALEDRIVELEKQPLPTKGKQYAVIGKGDSEEEDTIKAELLKRQEHLAVHPQDAKPGEMEQIYKGLRKAQVGESITIK